MANTVEAIGMIAAHRDNGVVLDSYIDDGLFWPEAVGVFAG